MIDVKQVSHRDSESQRKSEYFLRVSVTLRQKCKVIE